MGKNHRRRKPTKEQLSHCPGEFAKHSGLFLVMARPKTYDLCAPNPLSRSASFSDIYQTGGRFVGNQLRRFVSFFRCWVRSPPPLPTNCFRMNSVEVLRGDRRRQEELQGWHLWLSGTKSEQLLDKIKPIHPFSPDHAFLTQVTHREGHGHTSRLQP